MKKLLIILIAVLLLFTAAGCKGGGVLTNTDPNRADTSLRDGEMKLSGTVLQVSGNSLLIEDENGSRYTFSYSDEITVVEDGYYVVDLAADSFVGKDVTVIASEQVMETYPAMLSAERMIIIE